MRWFTKFANAPTLQSVITTSPKGNKFFNVMGNTFPIKDKLSGMGFKYFKGTWSIFLDKANSLRPQLDALGIDTSPLDQASQEPVPVQQQPSQVQPAEKQTEAGELDATLAQMKKAVEIAMQSGATAGGVKNILEVVDRELDKLAAMVDTHAKDAVVKAFLQFASKFWNYSMGNQILIWVQKPSATYVSGYKAWLEKGRQVTRWDDAISILAPRMAKVKAPDKKYNDHPDMENSPAEAESTRMYFVPVKVYDISATDPIPGWKDKEGNGPFVPPSLKIDDNEKQDHIEALTEAASRFAHQVDIKVDLEKVLEEQLGGYSSGKNVVVNQLYQGLNRFGTLIHELAHEILHREEDQVTPIKEERQAKEIDAETVSYIVLKHYGYESKSAPQYLALWRATGEDMKRRRNQVAKAVKIIIDNVNKQMGKVEMPEEESAATPVLAHWLLSGLRFSVGAK